MRALIITVSGFILLSGLEVAAQDEVDDVEDVTSELAAEDSTVDDMEPAVDTSADSIDEIDPAVPSPVLTADSRRPGTSSGVVDELDLDATEITGNQELPKVMYIVPWRESDPGDLMGRPGNTLLDDVLAPVDRGEFVREVGYYSDLFGDREEQ